MTCRCNFHSPFMWQSFPRPSLFSSDGAFSARSTGKTASQAASEAADKFQQERGYSMGSIAYLAKHGERLEDESRQKRTRRAGHYGGKGA